MKIFSVILALLSFISKSNAQQWCDTTFAVCDSIFIDSVQIIESETNGNWIYVDIEMNHAFLYAPTFVLCFDDENIELVDNEHDFFSLIGPNNTMLFYEFSNFALVGDSLIGRIIVNNSNSVFTHCEISFSEPVQLSTVGIEDELLNEVVIYPNPTSDYLFFNVGEQSHNVKNIQLVDNLGKVHQAKFNSDRIDLSSFTPGMYTVLFELSDKRIVPKTIFVK